MLNYDQPLYRPPSEAYSMIFQATLGCSWNKCAFCEMYTPKQFRIRKEEEVLSEIKLMAGYFPDNKKFFIADGDAFVLSFNKLKNIVDEIHTNFKRVQRISAYASASNILNKTHEELKYLADNKLNLIYLGIESGDDELLTAINKGESADKMKEALIKAQEAGIEASVMILNGLGGKKHMIQHALNSAKIANEVQPKFLSVLSLSLPYGIDHYQEKFKGEYIPMSTGEILTELKILIENTDLSNTIFRSDHISNVLSLKGTLGKNKQEILDQINFAISQTSHDEIPNVYRKNL